jgi:tetratricopeptide (TPR) repeat protein
MAHPIRFEDLKFEIQNCSDIDHFSSLIQKINEFSLETYKKAKDCLKSREFDKAAKLYRSIADVYRTGSNWMKEHDLDSFKSMSYLYSGMEKYWQSLADESSQQDFSEKISKIIIEGDDLQLERKYEDAIHVFDSALKLEPSNQDASQILIKKGNSFFYLDQLDNARKCYEDAKRSDPANVDAWSKEFYWIDLEDIQMLSSALNRV